MRPIFVKRNSYPATFCDWSGKLTKPLAALLAHNLNRELQMQVQPITRRTTEKRAALWKFQELNTLRRNLLQRAGRIIRPKGKVTLSLSDNPAVESELLHYLNALDQAA